MRRITISGTLAALALVCSCSPKTVADGEYNLDLYSTNDIHGRYFDSLYVGNNTKESLLAVSEQMNEIRAEKGAENVLLIDAGDCMQGDNAAYYFNYVDTKSKHVYARMAEYMKYDAVAVGNHDVETGHPVYDRIRKTMKVPFLAANAIRTSNGKPYFQEYTIVERGGLKVAIIGFTNANIKGWLSPEIFEGMEFESLIPCVQNVVDRIVAKEKPQVVVAAVHSGTGAGDGSSLESQGRDLLYSLEGVDFVLCSHDHRPYVEVKDSTALINSGSHCRNLGHGTITVTVKDGEVVGKKVSCDLVTIDKTKIDTVMRDMFRADYEKVREFTVQEVGILDMPLVTRDSYTGMSDYMNLIHTLGLSVKEAQLSFAAPLTFNGYVKEGTIIYNDLFTIYPYENQLFVVRMSGKEVKDYLEFSYDQWINTVASSDDTLLKIVSRDDPRTGQKGWSFVERSYNFDSMGGAFYSVDVTKPCGERIEINTLTDGTAFDLDGSYNVAMTSYRANGGGFILSKGAGIDTDNIDERVVARYPEIRQILYEYLKAHVDEEGKLVAVTAEELAEPTAVGGWSFIPYDIAEPALARDSERLFSRK